VQNEGVGVWGYGLANGKLKLQPQHFGHGFHHPKCWVALGRLQVVEGWQANVSQFGYILLPKAQGFAPGSEYRSNS
jgi:hypothetical protein